MVAQSRLVCPQFPKPIMKCAFAHFDAQGTGILLLPFPKDHVCDIAPDKMVRNAHLLYVLLHGRKIHIRESQANGHPHQFEMPGIVPLQGVQGAQKRHTVLPAG